MKLRELKSAVLSETNAAALEAAMNAWLAAGGQKVFVSITPPVWDGTNLNVVILYAE